MQYFDTLYIEMLEIRPNVDTQALVSVTAGAGMLLAILGGDGAIKEERIDSVLSLVMDGVRPRVGDGKRRSRGSTR